jgi:ABC-2 type transport system permease protein
MNTIEEGTFSGSRRMLSLMKKEFLQFFRNFALVAIVIFAVVVDPYAAGEMTFDIKNFPFAVLDLDKSFRSGEFLDKLREPYFNRVADTESFTKAQNMLTTSTVGMVIIIPEGFQRTITEGGTAGIQVLFDGTEPNSATVAVSYLAGIALRFSEEILVDAVDLSQTGIDGIPYINSETRVLFNENLYDSGFLVLAEFLNAVTLISILLPAAATVYEKQTGTMEQLIVTPLRVYEIMIAKIIPMSLVILGSTYFGIFLTLKALIGVPMRGSLAYFTLVTVVFLFTTSGLGMLVATIANNLAETILVTLILLIPIVFLSGSFTPPEAMPGWMQFLIMFSPLKYYLEICYGIFLRGVGFQETWPLLLIMSALGGAVFAAGAARFRRTFA